MLWIGNLFSNLELLKFDIFAYFCPVRLLKYDLSYYLEEYAIIQGSIDSYTTLF